MKIVFLDVDGVLNCNRTAVAFGGIPSGMKPGSVSRLDPVALGLIRRICAAADAKVVLSSTWRKCRPWQEYAIEFGLPIIGATPRWSERGHERGHEIADWLADHVECTHYAIVDDDSDMLPHQMPQLVHTNGFDGFTWANAERLAQILGINVWDCRRIPAANE